MTMPKTVMMAIVALCAAGCAAPPKLPPEEHWSRGTQAYCATQYKKAIYHFEAILADSSPPDGMGPATLFFLGEAYTRVGEKKKARKAFKTLLQKYPRSSYARQAYSRN